MAKRTIDQIFTKAYNKYGAQTGRPNIGEKPEDGTKVYDCKVRMYDGAYDKGGAYWGAAIHGVKPLRVEYTKDLTYVCFYRGDSARG